MPDRTTTPFRPVPGAKVAVARLPGIFVPRPRLHALFDRATARPVTVVRAPAGAGKTTALAGWAGEGRDVAWVSLDEEDNDESRLWTAILAALRRCPGIPEHRLGLPAPGRRRAFLADLEDAFAGLDHPVRLVLDDLQEISRPEPLEALAALAHQLPSGLRLVLATRVEPRLRLARLHVEGRLSRVEAGELRFTVRETAGLLRATGAAVADDRLRELTERTAGWAAALGWAAVSVREAEDADALVASVTGDDRAVARFFADEVLSRLPEPTSDLLRCLSVCDTASAALAVRLSGRPEAGARLDELERAMGLVTRTPADTYRLPPLLRAFLRADLARRDPRRVPRLHGIAARWYAGDGRFGEALRHAVAGRDRPRVLALARDHGVRQVLAGDGEPVRVALTYLGTETVASSPPLRLASALENIQRGQLAEAAADLGAVGSRLRSGSESVQRELAGAAADLGGAGSGAGLESTQGVRLAEVGADLGGAGSAAGLELARAAADLGGVGSPLGSGAGLENGRRGELAEAAADLGGVGSPSGSAAGPGLAQAAADLGAAGGGWWPLATRHLAFVTGTRPPPLEAGTPVSRPLELDAWVNLDRACRSLGRGARRHAVTQAQEALRLAHGERLEHLVLHSRLVLAVATAVGGDYPAMRRACTGALAVARRHGWRRVPGVAECHLLLAYDDLVRAEPVAAARELAQAASAEVPGGMPLLGPLREFFEGMVRFDDGDRTAGSQVMRAARHRLAVLEVPRELVGVCAVAEHHAALALGEGLHAAEVLAWGHERLAGSGELAVLRIRAHLAAGETDAAEAVLRETASANSLLPATPVERCLAETALALRSHRRTKALHALDRALALARPNGLVRPFALAEPRVGHLLIDHSGGFGSLDRFAQAVHGRLVPHTPPSSLTDREQVVLQRLPSQRSLDEIASDLTVSVNTVKTHVRAIYGKLGVNNRRSAVVVARQHGLT